MTPDDLRKRLAAAMDGAPKVPGECPMCHGTGTANRKSLTQDDVAKAIGVPRPSVSSFLRGKQTFGMSATLRLIDFLADSEPKP